MPATSVSEIRDHGGAIKAEIQLFHFAEIEISRPEYDDMRESHGMWL